MKKKVLFYIVAVITTLSLQSCVTNYVVSAPATYKDEYKSNAKLASLDQQKLDKAKKELLSSFVDNKSTQLASIEASLKNEEVSKSLKFSKTIDGLLSEAESYLGTPYRYGGMTRNGIDCSAFVLSVFGATLGMQLPRVAASQSQEGEKIEKTDLQKGDLVFFSQGRRISHVGIVYDVNEAGEVKFIHAATSRGVMVSSLTDSSWGPTFRFAKRVISKDVDYSVNYAQAN